jgi:hypothetical protein
MSPSLCDHYLSRAVIIHQSICHHAQDPLGSSDGSVEPPEMEQNSLVLPSSARQAGLINNILPIVSSSPYDRLKIEIYFSMVITQQSWDRIPGRNDYALVMLCYDTYLSPSPISLLIGTKSQTSPVILANNN